jgi:signal transduction histidine kinase
MKIKFHWKIMLAATLPVIVVITGTIWLAFDQLAADYFMVLMDKYMVSPTETHNAFLTAVHRYLLWSSLVALVLAFFFSFLLTRHVLGPLMQISNASHRIAKGDFSPRVQVSYDDEIGELGKAFNKMGDSLEKLENLRKTMVSDVAHELRTPLTNLRGYLEGLTEGIIPANKETFEMLQQENLRLVKLVENLGQLARADAAEAYLSRQPLDIIRCINDILDLYKMAIESKAIQVITNFPSKTPLVSADRDKILQALRNLVDNCIKYSPQGGTVAINIFPLAKRIRVEFVNDGQGISEADLPHIFERFYRAEFSRSRDVGGAGIGLAIVQQLVQGHGGKVGAESAPGKTLVWIELPR